MAAPARVAAFEALVAVEANAADLPAALERARRALPDERDRALAAEIATGTLRWQSELDFLIDAAVDRPERLTREVRTLLRLSSYQLVHLDRVPARAVVHDAVDMARERGQAAAAGLVNAVLRRLADPARRPPLPGPASPLDYLAVTCSMPRWLAARWLDRYGPEGAAEWARFCASPAPMVVRANRLRTTREALADSLAAEGVLTAPARWAPDALVIVSGRVMQTECFALGHFLVQDEASQLVALAAGVTAGEMVLDTCAAPGGKASALAASTGPTGQLIAVDLRPKRVALLRETLARAGAERAGIVRADARRGLPFRPIFDVVVVDAPCSGLGTIRRDPDVKWRRAEGGLAGFAAAQRDLLRQAVEAIKPGGRLLYATCSSEPEENEQVVDALLTDSPALVPQPLAETPWWPRELFPLLDAAGRLKTEPPRHGLEAFFAALFVRRA